MKRLLPLFVLLLVPFPAFAQETDPRPVIEFQSPLAPLPADETPVFVTTQDVVSLRAEPSRGGARLAVVNYGLRLPAVGRVPGWLQVEYEGQRGWIAGWLLTWEGDPRILPDTVTPTLYTSTNATALTLDFVTLRAGPGVYWDALDVLPPNTTLAAVGRSGYWLQVEHNGQFGWLHYQHIRGFGDVDSLPIDGIDPLPFIRLRNNQPQVSFLGPSVGVVFRERYRAAYLELDETYLQISGFWRVVADGDMVSCAFVPAPVPGALQLDAAAIQAFPGPLSLQYEAARTTWNAAAGHLNTAIGLAQTVCARTDTPFATQSDLDTALGALRQAAANLNVMRGTLF